MFYVCIIKKKVFVGDIVLFLYILCMYNKKVFVGEIVLFLFWILKERNDLNRKNVPISQFFIR